MLDFDIRRFEILPLLDDIKINDKIPIQITCIEVYNQNIYLGTADSFILLYSKIFQNQHTNYGSTAIKPSCYKYLGMKKSITQLKVLSVLSRLLCICDNTLILSNLDNLELINNFKVRNVFACCLNENPISMEPYNIELCMAKRKSLTIALLKSDKMTILKDVNVPEQPVILAMNGHYICMASATSYYMVNWETNSSQVLCGINSESCSLPVCKYISRNEFLINGPSHLGVFVKTSGISERPPINWGVNVSQIAYSYPYILCLKPHSISIISIIDREVKDEFLLENGVHMDNFDGKIVVATKESIFSMHCISWEEQIDSLLLNEKSQEAIDLFHNIYQSGMIINKESDYIESIYFRAGLNELKKQNFNLARQFLIKSHCMIERLFSLNKNLTKKLNISLQETCPHIQILIDKIQNGIDLGIINEFLLDYIQELIDHESENITNISLVKTGQLLLYFEDRTSYVDYIKKFFDENHNYNFELIEKYLHDHKYFYHLALFYASRNQIEKSIELLKNLEKRTIQDDHYPGISVLSQILTKCKNTQLIINHIDFILEQNYQEGVRILIENTIIEQNKYLILNPEFVVTLLHKYRGALVIYLEHLIFNMHIKSIQVHTKLVIIYIEILSLQKENEEQKSKLYEETKTKLKRMLEESDHYDKRIVLKNLIQNGLDYETAFLYGKIGDHQKAFEIYLCDRYLDHDQALKHCIHYGLKDDSNDLRIYQTLLTMYMDLYRKNGPEVMKPLLEYLNHSKCHFDLKVTLNELPENWPVILLERHLSNHLNGIFHAKFQSSFGRVLALSLFEREKKEKHRLINRPIRIDRDSICFICHTKLLESKFVWIPSNKSVVHDFCYYSTTLPSNVDKIDDHDN